MKALEITPILLAGGGGTRLWPLSRKSYPKQFSNIIGDQSLFESTARRLMSSSTLKFTAPIAITAESYRFLVRKQLSDIGVMPASLIIEPNMKNTAPAILAATLHAQMTNPDAIMIASPTDHIISDTESFHKAVSIGLQEIERGKIVIFGIKPNRVETGYGHIKCSFFDSAAPAEVTGFVEKPSKSLAEAMTDSENYLWNAGIFLFKAKDLIEEFRTHATEILHATSNALERAYIDLDFLKLDPSAWSKNPDISIDYALMEKSKNLMAVSLPSEWSDMGSWQAVWREKAQKENEVVLSSNATSIDCSDCLIRSESQDQHIVGFGLKGIIAVAMSDAVLVCDKSRSQEVKQIVSTLKAKDIKQAELAFRDYRPWGWFEVLVKSAGFQVKRLYVNPKSSLSLQSHKHRSEHWVVVEGKAEVTLSEQVRLLSPSESVSIPENSVHRLANREAEPLIVIEIQMGAYLEEDDIIRYDDEYAR